MKLTNSNIFSVPVESIKRIKKLEKEKSKEKRKTLRMFNALDIDRIKIPKEILE